MWWDTHAQLKTLSGMDAKTVVLKLGLDWTGWVGYLWALVGIGDLTMQIMLMVEN